MHLAAKYTATTYSREINEIKTTISSISIPYFKDKPEILSVHAIDIFFLASVYFVRSCLCRKYCKCCTLFFYISTRDACRTVHSAAQFVYLLYIVSM